MSCYLGNKSGISTTCICSMEKYLQYLPSSSVLFDESLFLVNTGVATNMNISRGMFRKDIINILSYFADQYRPVIPWTTASKDEIGTVNKGQVKAHVRETRVLLGESLPHGNSPFL